MTGWDRLERLEKRWRREGLADVVDVAAFELWPGLVAYLLASEIR